MLNMKEWRLTPSFSRFEAYIIPPCSSNLWGCKFNDLKA